MVGSSRKTACPEISKINVHIIGYIGEVHYYKIQK